MNRRQFITGLPAAFLIAGQEAVAAPPAHPFAALKDLATGDNFVPDPQKFTLALFMTAQKFYPSCGSAFMTAQIVVESHSRVQPVLVMPKVSDQPDRNDLTNLTAAMNSPAGFKILTGELSQVQAAARALGAEFTFSGTKVDGHPQQAFFLTPSGQKLFHSSYDDHITIGFTIQDLLSACERRSSAPACQ